MPGMPGVQINERLDVFPSAVFINSVSVVCRIQEELLNTEFRKVCFHGEKGMEKGKQVMAGSPFQKWEYWKITMGIGSYIHVEVGTEEIALPVGIPSPVAVRLGIMTLAAAGGTAVFPAFTGPLFPLLSGSTDWSTVTGSRNRSGKDPDTRTARYNSRCF